MNPKAGPFQFAIMRTTVKIMNSRFSRIVMNDSWVKLLIITGALKWYDAPHLHHPLIFLRIQIEYLFDRKRERKMEQ